MDVRREWDDLPETIRRLTERIADLEETLARLRVTDLADTPSTLGSSGQVLTVDSTGNSMTWANN